MINKEELYQYYIVENHGYYETQKHFNISSYMMDKLLRQYNIHKSRKQSASLVLESKYNTSGSKEAYNKHMREKSIETWAEKYGSYDNFLAHLSSKDSAAWVNKSPDELSERAQRIMSNGGGWNHETAKKTLQEKYGVNNAYALSKFTSISKINYEIGLLLNDKGLEFTSEFVVKDSKKYYKYDFAINNNLLEIDPWIFHNSTWTPIKNASPTDKNYHYNKSVFAVKNGYRCIHVWDWDDITKIISILKPREKVYARNCIVKEIDRDITKEYINTNHLQGYSKDNIRLGLICNNELVSVMTFGKPRYNKNYEYELIRFCSHKFVLGGSEKLFKYFITNYSPASIISYCDNGKFTGAMYTRLGFDLKSKGTPTKHWYNPKTKKHITDNLLRQRGFDQLLGKEYGCFGKGTSNEELMRTHDFVEIYDCGQSSYEWKNPTGSNIS